MNTGEDDLAWLTQAVGAVVIQRELRGTAYLVAPDRMATCSHVVETAVPGQPFKVYLPEGVKLATVEKQHEGADAALLRLESPAKARPLVLARRPPPADARWRASGYPGIGTNPDAPRPVLHTIAGEVRHAAGHDARGRPALQLFSSDLGAGQGGLAQGFSGSPVLVDRAVVGHLASVLITYSDGANGPPRAEMGRGFACPVLAVLDLLGGPEKPRRAPRPPSAPFDPAWYVRRTRVENDALRRLQSGAPFYLAGPAKSGKTHMIAYLLGELRKQEGSDQESTVIVVPLATCPKGKLEKPTAEEDLAGFLAAMARLLVADVRGPGADVLRARGPGWVAALAAGSGSWLQRIYDLLEKHVLPCVPHRLVLVVEGADAAWGTYYAEAVYDQMFRHFCNEAAYKPQWQKLSLLLAVGTGLRRLPDDPLGQGSPLNIGDPLTLNDFTEKQIVELAGLYDLHCSDVIAKRLLKEVGGDPYVLRTLFYAVATAEDPTPIEVVLDDEETLLTLLEDHFSPITDELQDDPDLWAAMTYVLWSQGEEPDPRTVRILIAAGVLMREKGKLRVRHPLYKRSLERVSLP
jgi:hypothetical protein